MYGLSRLPKRFPVGTKYVVEGRGPFVQRYVEFPDGRRIQLETRRALSCRCAELQEISIAPDRSSVVADTVNASTPKKASLFEP